VSPEPGWYRDQNAVVRWWNGSGWTSDTRHDPDPSESSHGAAGPPGTAIVPSAPAQGATRLMVAGLPEPPPWGSAAELWWNSAQRVSQRIGAIGASGGVSILLVSSLLVSRVGLVTAALLAVVVGAVAVLSSRAARFFDDVGRAGWAAALPRLSALLTWIGAAAVAGAVVVALSAVVYGHPLAAALGILPLIQAVEPLVDGIRLRSAGNTIAGYGLDLDALHSEHRARKNATLLTNRKRLGGGLLFFGVFQILLLVAFVAILEFPTSPLLDMGLVEVFLLSVTIILAGFLIGSSSTSRVVLSTLASIMATLVVLVVMTVSIDVENRSADLSHVGIESLFVMVVVMSARSPIFFTLDLRNAIEK
jgi:hypothetical protein